MGPHPHLPPYQALTSLPGTYKYHTDNNYTEWVRFETAVWPPRPRAPSPGCGFLRFQPTGSFLAMRCGNLLVRLTLHLISCVLHWINFGSQNKISSPYIAIAGSSSSQQNLVSTSFCNCVRLILMVDEVDTPRREIFGHSPIIEQVTWKYKLKLKYGVFIDKNSKEQRFIIIDSDESFMVMLNMYKEEKEVIIYATTEKITQKMYKSFSGQDQVIDESDDENDSDSNCPSEESYHSRHSSSNEYELLNSDFKSYSYSNKNAVMKVNSKFPNVIAFRRALNNYAITNEFQYIIGKSDLTRLTACCEDKKCEWRIHASLTKDEVTFEVKKFVETRSCTRSNKCGNKHATQGWIGDVLTDKLKSDGDVSPANLKKWCMQSYNVDELEQRNPRSVVEIDLQTEDNKKHFLRFFISLTACSKGFLSSCRPYIVIDACHLKEKFNGVLAAATSIDDNHGMFPVAYGVLESENKNSWTWFLKSLEKAIGTPDGLVISSDKQKGLEVAITQVYPNVKHRECIRHLYSNFKKHYRGDYFITKLWDAAKTYSISKHDRLLNEIASVTYVINQCSISLMQLEKSLCNDLTKKRKIVNKWKGTLVPKAKNYLKRISKNLGNFEVCRSSDNRAQVNYKGKRWEVILDEIKCSCRVWKVKGLPCVHAAANIAFTRDPDWDIYVDTYFTIDKFKEAYALEIAPMSGKDQWVHIKTIEKIYPPIIKRPPGRPKKNRIVPRDEPKKRHRCPRCGMFGHHQKTCKNLERQGSDDASTSKNKEQKRS
ncbi:unnamed protein product [Lactuca saligna]|uniref:SWIM-type domain-containing protein n=1 Tax=Lactuca saligna TaxID=75948 RepID=A0AA36EF53_LACSI|nr:unnamed protein product [Lactuca saligna]